MEVGTTSTGGGAEPGLDQGNARADRAIVIRRRMMILISRARRCACRVRQCLRLTGFEQSRQPEIVAMHVAE